MTRILVTGAAGSIGSEIVRQLGDCVAVDNDEAALFRLDHKDSILGDINKPTFIDRYQPHVVIHAAAYKHVPFAEDNIEAVVENNVNGTMRLLEACRAAGVGKFIFISTDKAAMPISVMGLTKAIGERLVMATPFARKICVRFGNVLHSSGSVMEIFEKQKKQGRVTVTHKDCERYFIDRTTAVHRLLALSNSESGIYVLDCGEPVKITDMVPTRCKIEYIGLRPGEKIVETLTNENELLEVYAQGIFKVVT